MYNFLFVINKSLWNSGLLRAKEHLYTSLCFVLSFKHIPFHLFLYYPFINNWLQYHFGAEMNDTF